MAFKIQLRRGTAAQWTAANPILADGEVGIVTDEDTLKVGDGTTAWNSLAYSGMLIAPGTVTETKIANNAVTTNKINNAAVTSGKLASGAAAANLGFTPASTGKAIAMAIVFGG